MTKSSAVSSSEECLCELLGRRALYGDRAEGSSLRRRVTLSQHRIAAPYLCYRLPLHCDCVWRFGVERAAPYLCYRLPVLCSETMLGD